MSIVSNVHSILPLEKDSKPLNGQRLARVIAKKNKDGEYESENLTQSLCVSVPFITDEEISDVIAELLPHIRNMCEDAQDKLIREFRVQHGRNEIPQDAIAMDAIVQFLNESANGSRITKEWMQGWFTESYSEAATAFIRSAIDGAAEKVIEQKVNVLRDMFSGFASARYSPEIPKCKAMLRFGAYVGEENWDARMKMIQTKTSKILAEKEAELQADALGF